MSKKIGRKVVGTGISRRTRAVRTLDPNSEHEAEKFISAIRHRNKALSKPWAGQSRLIGDVRARLAELVKLVPAGSDDLDGFNAHYRERDSELWYLWQIDVCAAVAEIAIQEGRPWEAVEQAMLIGEYLTELRTKFRWDEFAILGEKVNERIRQGAQLRRRRSAQQRCDMVQALVEKGHSLSRAFALVGMKEDSSPSTIKRDWYAQSSNKKLVQTT